MSLLLRLILRCSILLPFNKKQKSGHDLIWPVYKERNTLLQIWYEPIYVYNERKIPNLEMCHNVDCSFYTRQK
jgi:hypothetical protein